MRTFILTGLVIVIVGCGGYKPPPAPKTVAVKGKVILPNGSPATGGLITFKPNNPGKFQAGTAEIGGDGSFVATSFNKEDGLQPGEEYTAYVEPVSYKTGRAVAIKGIPAKYQKATTSDLILKVDKVEENLVLRMR